MKRFAFSLLASVLCAQDAIPLVARVPVVQAQGRATVSAKPDQVSIDIGVLTQARTAQEASANNARQFTEVVAALKKAAGAGADIQTVSYSVQPVYRYPKEGGTPTITGYQAINVVRVRSSNVDSAGAILDAGTGTGANSIRGIHFSIKDERALRAQALREAARDARASAEGMASGLGLKIQRVLRIEDHDTPRPRPMQEAMMMRQMATDQAAPPPPVEAGVIEVNASVTLTVEVGP